MWLPWVEGEYPGRTKAEGGYLLKVRFQTLLRKCSSAHRIAEEFAALARLFWYELLGKQDAAFYSAERSTGSQQLRVWVYSGGQKLGWAGGHNVGRGLWTVGFCVERAMGKLSPGQARLQVCQGTACSGRVAGEDQQITSPLLTSPYSKQQESPFLLQYPSSTLYQEHLVSMMPT